MITKYFLSAAIALMVPIFSAHSQARSATVTTNGARIYDRPSVIGEKRADVPVSTAVRVLDTDEEWYVVRIGDVVGWMPASAITINASSAQKNGSLNKMGLVEADPRPAPRSSASGRAYTRGPRGGCYYISGSGRKVYVDRSLCG